MIRIRRKSLTVFLGSIFQALVLHGGEFPITKMEAFNEICVEHGRRLLELKQIPYANTNLWVSSWCFPTSIVVGAVGYDVKGGEDYRIVEKNAPHRCLLEGELYRMSNAYDARVCALGILGMNNLGPRSYAPSVSVSFLDPSTNVIFVTDQRRSVYVYSNLFLTMRGGTNHLEFASALIAAGL